MKKFLSILCLLSLVALLSACNNGDNGSKGSTIPHVSWEANDNGRVNCYGASKSVVAGDNQTCIWNCAILDGSPPSSYTITFDDVPDVESIHKGKCRL